MNLKKYGPTAVLIEFEQQIDESVHQKVMLLYHFLNQRSIEWLKAIIPAYCSLTVVYEPALISFKQLCEFFQSIETSSVKREKGRLIHIPVCYHSEFAADLSAVIQYTGLSDNEIIELHTGQDYKVYMMGFVPGFAYMGKLDERLYCPRKETPRQQVAVGAVAIAAHQTAIYPCSSPGGWQIIGCTPIPLVNIIDDASFLFKIGDAVRFEPVSVKQYHKIKKDCLNNALSWATFISEL